MSLKCVRNFWLYSVSIVLYIALWKHFMYKIPENRYCRPPGAAAFKAALLHSQPVSGYLCVCVCVWCVCCVWITGTRENSFLLKTQEATAWAEEKTTTLSKANPSEVLPLETETVPAHCVSVSNTFLNNSITVYNVFLKSAEGIKKTKVRNNEIS